MKSEYGVVAISLLFGCLSGPSRLPWITSFPTQGHFPCTDSHCPSTLVIALVLYINNASSSVPVPVEIQLMAGTLLLEESDYPVTPEQAQTLVPAWQMFQALLQSGTASDEEIAIVVGQIQVAMTPDQLAAIEEMQLTADDVRDTAQGLGITPQGLPAGMTPADIMRLSTEERAKFMASRAGQGLVGKLIELLEARAGEA